MRVAIIGAGYVGLVSGTCFSEFGHDVICIDKDAERIEGLNEGRMPIYEPGLDTLVESNVKAGRLSFSADLSSDVGAVDAIFIAVGTPPSPDDGHADLQYVYAAVREVAGILNGYTVIVTKSTVPVGTGRAIEQLIREINAEAEFDVVSNRNFSAKAAPLRISCGRTGLSSAATVRKPATSCGSSTGRCS